MTLIEQLERAQEIRSKASEGGVVVKEQESEVVAAKREASSLIEEVKRKILDGETTGDLALDLQILATDTAEKDQRYRRMKRFTRQLQDHAGQLVLVHHSSWSFTMAVLPDEPTVSFDRGTRFSHQRGVHLAVERSLRQAEPKDRPIPLDYFALTSPSTSWGMSVIVGDEAVVRYCRKATLHAAQKVWAEARQLGRPFVPPDKLAKEIQTKREDMVAELCGKMGEIESLLGDLKHYQRNPAQSLKLYNAKVTPAPNGVSIDFGFGEKLDKLKTGLGKLVERAEVDLDMSDNKTFQKAKQMFST